MSLTKVENIIKRQGEAAFCQHCLREELAKFEKSASSYYVRTMDDMRVVDVCYGCKGRDWVTPIEVWRMDPLR